MTSDAAKLESIANLARALTENPRGRASLAAFQDDISRGHGELVFEALLQAQRDRTSDEQSALVALMALLEASIDANPSVATYLMARLYPIAGRRHLHHVHDAIELWMHESVRQDVADSLTRLAAEGVAPRLRSRYQAWAAKIRRS